MTDAVIRIVAAVVLDEAQRVLVVRKRGTSSFMQPGGKIEPGESPVQALAREVGEELGTGFDASTVRALGRFSAPAANEPDMSSTPICSWFASTTCLGPRRRSSSSRGSTRRRPATWS